VRGVRVEITQAGSDRLSALASVLGRAFVVEPMMRWPLGGCVDVEERLIRCFEYFIEDLIQVGTVWEAGEAKGAARVDTSGSDGRLGGGAAGPA
jgi:hypothetical protein